MLLGSRFRGDERASLYGTALFSSFRGAGEAPRARNPTRKPVCGFRTASLCSASGMTVMRGLVSTETDTGSLWTYSVSAGRQPPTTQIINRACWAVPIGNGPILHRIGINRRGRSKLNQAENPVGSDDG